MKVKKVLHVMREILILVCRLVKRIIAATCDEQDLKSNESSHKGGNYDK